MRKKGQEETRRGGQYKSFRHTNATDKGISQPKTPALYNKGREGALTLSLPCIF